MTLNDIFIKNFKHNLNQFISYFFVNSFIVAILFMYGSLLFNEKLLNNLSMDLVSSLISYAAYATIIFSIIFVSYTSIYFVKSRGKEFGLYLTLGMTTTDLVKLILFENLMILLGSVTIGIVTGTIFSKLFYLVIVNLLHIKEDIYDLNYKTFLVSIGFFILVFIFNMIFTSRFIKTLSIVNITKSNQKKGISKSHPLIGAVSIAFFIISLGAFYIGAKGDLPSFVFIKKYESILRPLFIILFVTSLYFVIATSIDMISRIMTRFPKLYHKHLLILSNIKHRFFSYKVSLYVVTLLISLSIYFIGFGVSTYLFIEDNINDYIPYDFMIESTNDHNVISQNEMESIVSNEQGAISTFSTLEFIIIDRFETQLNEQVDYIKKPNILISESNFNQHLNLSIDLEADELLLVFNEKAYQDMTTPTSILMFNETNSNQISVEALNNINNLSELSNTLSDANLLTYSAEKTSTMVAPFINSYGDFDFVGVTANVIDDDVYESLTNLNKRTVHLFNLSSGDSTKIQAALSDYLKEQNLEQFQKNDELQMTYAKEKTNFLEPMSKEIILTGAFQTTGITFFSVFFLGLLFLISAVIVLYYKIYTDVDDEKEQINKFQKLGITPSECITYITKHITLLFFIPLMLGLFIGLYFIYISFMFSAKVSLIMLVVAIVYLIFGYLLFISLKNKFIIRLGL